MGLVFAPSAGALLSVVSPAQAGPGLGDQQRHPRGRRRLRRGGAGHGVQPVGRLHLAAGVRRRHRRRRCGSASAVVAVGRRSSAPGAPAPRARPGARRDAGRWRAAADAPIVPAMHEPLEGIARGRRRPRPAVPAPAGGAAARALGRRGAGRRARGGGRLEPRRHPRRRARAPGALRRARAAAGARPARRAAAGRARTAIAVRTARAGRGAAVAAPRDRAALAARRPASAADGPGAVGARGAARRWRVRCRVAAHWAGACIATSSSGWSAARCWP